MHALAGQTLDALDTPQLVLDLDVLDGNLAAIDEGLCQDR